MEKRFLCLIGVTAIALLLGWTIPVMAQTAACASATQQVGATIDFPYPVIICIADMDGNGQQKIILGMRAKITQVSTGTVFDAYQIGIVGKVGDLFPKTIILFPEAHNK
jgi:hypothetical protein